MNIKAVGYYIGHVLRLIAVMMLPALLIAFFGREEGTVLAFALSMGITMAAGCLMFLLKRPGEGGVRPVEGFITVSLSWILISLFGALPFYISGQIPRFIDCFFETVSGFTTTGATILTNIEGLSRSLLYWRSFTHWIGGMGVLVFMLAIVPLSKGNGESMHLLRAESPGPAVGKLTAKMSSSTRVLYLIYVAMTAVLVILLLLGGMPLFDSIVNAFATAGTGGFAIKNASIAAYPSHYLQTVIAIGMVLFGVNFNVYYFILIGKGVQALKGDEFRAYIGIIAASTLLIAVNIMPIYNSFGESLHQSFFQVSSIITTTGFVTTDFDKWPELSRMIIVALMIIGASAGSTGGGVKIARVVMLFKSLKVEVLRAVRPRRVETICMDGKRIDASTMGGVYGYFAAFAAICGASMLVLSLDNFDFTTTVTGVLTCIGNVGPGLSMVGPSGNFSAMSDLSKIVLSLDMLFGRLEIFPLTLLFSPRVWRRKG